MDAVVPVVRRGTAGANTKPFTALVC